MNKPIFNCDLILEIPQVLFPTLYIIFYSLEVSNILFNSFAKFCKERERGTKGGARRRGKLRNKRENRAAIEARGREESLKVLFNYTQVQRFAVIK